MSKKENLLFESEEKINVSIEKQQSVIKLNFRALLRAEQTALALLYLSKQPLKLSQILSRIIQDAADQQLRYSKAGGKRYTDAIIANNKTGLTGLIQTWRLKSADFPSLPTLQKMLEDFAGIGWVGIRNNGRDRFYYLKDGAISQLNDEIINSLDLPFDKPFKII